MTDVSKNKEWKPRLGEWRALVLPFGCEVAASPHAYEIAKVSGPGVSLIIYPHKSTSGHHSARVRNNNSKDVELARKTIAALHLWCKEDCHLWMYGYTPPSNDGQSPGE